jgi:hypothetical protein
MWGFIVGFVLGALCMVAVVAVLAHIEFSPEHKRRRRERNQTLG